MCIFTSDEDVCGGEHKDNKEVPCFEEFNIENQSL